ncbi:Membrane protein involved in the export of O-antigen and teichoic acid [Micromonospora phaseoli]|uniref:Membrane protein involved in the export of O-antigen and teichoic acid n=1 Tax=Micromonospora phaseoli TaxID=1144548 RepID=A0A1H7CSY0_9ACTN|nr:flippase [Micromonospora phaseoli]PZV91522.1 O-antigen/teichoic acid export membrane protein [Micromonospora phaseoli]GIJ80070.1 polysaccharide biosynthesis protein [Micromonospora phaseoli]SEJ92768.1 Membrane protein involved in the export of O-antigen and teichoic acid [Micromonospora phaseoli]
MSSPWPTTTEPGERGAPPEPGATGEAVGTAGSRSARGLSMATAVSLGLRLVGMAVGMATTSVLARYLNPDGYGVFALALTLGTAAAQVADMGTTITVSSRIAREKVSAGRILTTGLAIRTAVALVATVILLVAAAQGLFGESSAVVSVVAVATPLSAASILTAGATARFRPEVSAILALVQGVLWLIAVVVIARTGGDVMLLAWLFVAVVTLQTGIGVMINRRLVPLGRPSWTEVGRILALSWPLAISSLAVMVYYRLGSVVLFHLQGAAEVGYYSAAYKFLDVAQLGPAMLVAPLLPIVATSMSMNGHRRNLVFSLATRTGMVVGVGSAVMLVALAPVLVAFLYGEDYGPAVRPLMLLAVAFVGVTLGYVGTTICSALGVVRPIAVLTVSVAVVNLAAQFWACARWGATGAAAVVAGTELIIGLSTCLLAARAMTSRLPVREVACVALAGVATIGLLWLVDLPWPIEAALAGGLFGVAVLVSRALTMTDLTRVLSRKAL